MVLKCFFVVVVVGFFVLFFNRDKSKQQYKMVATQEISKILLVTDMQVLHCPQVPSSEKKKQSPQCGCFSSPVISSTIAE